MRKIGWALALLLAGGWALGPIERELGRQRAAAGYGGIRMSQEVRRELPQELAIGLLAGFRGLAADFIWIQAHGYWEQKEWLRMYRNMRAATILQPKSVLFWDLAAWHMGWNIAYAARVDPANSSRAEGLKREREWQTRAREFLEEGLHHNPRRHELYFALGWMYWKKLDDPCRARDYFGAAAEFADAPSYTLRIYARAIEECGDPRAAYEFWKQLWKDGNPDPFSDAISPRSVIPRELHRLEDLLQIPNDQRIFPTSRATPAGQVS